MTSDFYLTLPSNASMKMFPDNTLAHYITDLPRRIDLTGEWECGLAEIQYPHTWYNIGKYDTWVFLNETIAMGLTLSAKISAGYYKSPMTLMNHVNKGLNTMVTEKVRAKLSYTAITPKMTLHMTPGTEFTVPHRSALGRMLGFEPSVVSSPPSLASAGPSVLGSVMSAITTTATATEMTSTDENPRLGGRNIGLTPSASVFLPPKETRDGPYTYRKEAEHVVQMDQGFDTIYVYTDVVESRIVGDSVAPLLRALPVGGSHVETVSDRFTNIHYVPLLYSPFKSIEIDIRDDTGRRVPFSTAQDRTFLKMNYNDYYARQACGALPYFAGAQYQRGHRLGSLFGGLLRSAMPLIKRGAVALGMGALKTGVRIADDVMSGQSIKKATKRRFADAGRNLMRGLLAPGVRPRKRIKRAPAKKGVTLAKRRRKRQTSTKREADIFDNDDGFRT